VSFKVDPSDVDEDIAEKNPRAAESSFQRVLAKYPDQPRAWYGMGLVALLDREVSGQGRWVQTSLIEAGLTLLDFQATRWTMDKKIPPQEGNNHPTNTPMGCFRTADGHINIVATSNKNFQIFCKLAAGRGVSDIANELSLSVKTVSTYRSRILEKMSFTANADITSYALRNGLIQ